MKHTQAVSNGYPTIRKVRRDCSKELYRAIKKMNIYIEANKIEEAEKYYTKQVVTHYQTIREMSNNKRAQVQWWDEHCSEQIAQLLDVNRDSLVSAFTKAYLKSN